MTKGCFGFPKKAVDFEFRRVINDHLQAENRTGFVVHFEPVLFHPVFDANAGKPFEGESIRSLTTSP
jgi:hypothetical protein